jgi:LPS sulfotransferase NodH
LKKKYVYILSQRYSGSTLLSFLLGTHPDIATIGERRKFYNKSLRPKANENQDCSCGEKFVDCTFWTAIKERVMKRVSSKELMTNTTEFYFFNSKYINHLATKVYQFFLLNNFLRLMQPFSKTMKRLLDFNQVLVEETLNLTGKTAFLDSSKIIDHALYLSQIKDFDFYVIWLSRDPRAQVFSALKYNNWTIKEAARKWRDEMNKNIRILDKNRMNYTHLSYEKLCQNPEEEMRRILEFCGLDTNTFSIDFRQRTQHIMGNDKMRLGEDSKIEERKDWQENLSRMDVSMIEKITASYQKYYAN